jgi:hypothetical protein
MIANCALIAAVILLVGLAFLVQELAFLRLYARLILQH